MAAFKALLSDQELWKSIYPKLIYFAILQTRANHLPKDKAKDLVQEAIKRLLAGERNWEPEKVDLLTFLKGVIRSLASHEAESSYRKRRENRIEDDDRETSDLIETTPCNEPDPHQELEGNELFQYLWDYASDISDENMMLVLLCLDEEKRRKDISEELNIPVNEVDSIMKRIRRAALKYLDQHNK